jgi:xylan 1,4-beta-xylosidase
MLGRETALQKVAWSPDGWLRLADGGQHPYVTVPAPAGLAPTNWPVMPHRDDFDDAKLAPSWSTLRVPADESWLSLSERPGWLRLRGRDSQHSLFEQSLAAKRLGNFRAQAETRMEFTPNHFTQMAGLICYYDTRTHFYLRVSQEETLGKVLGIVLTDDGVYDELLDSQIAINDWSRIYLRATIDHQRLQFSASPDGKLWRAIGPCLDASKLSDDYGQGLHFTGAMIGLCAQDVGGTRRAADFDYFDLRPLEV